MSTPFDLHVLSTPPAFILSQDQTLNKMVFKEPSGSLNQSYRNLISKLQRNVNGCLYKLFWAFTTNSFWCFVFVMLFNLQGAHRSQRRAFILPQLSSFVKHFFQVFQTLSCSHSQVLAVLSAVLADSLVMLPHSFSLVKHFFKFFKLFRARSWKNSVVSAVLLDSS